MNEQPETLKTLIDRATWINTALLSLLILLAFSKPEPIPMRHGILLLVTWCIYAARHHKAASYSSNAMLLLAIMQLTNLAVAGIAVFMIFVR